MTAPPQHGRPDQGLSRGQRLTSNRSFQETYGQGCREVGRYMVLWVRSGADAAGRLGVVSSKKVGNAVHRNLARRRLREAFRTQRAQIRTRCDVVIVARRNLLGATQEEVAREMRRLMRRAGLMPGRDER